MRDCAESFGRPDLALLCGMAMGIPQGAKPAVGDVIVASVVFDTSPKRVGSDGDHSRAEPYRLSPAIFFDTSAHIRRLTGFQSCLEGATKILVKSHEYPAGLNDDWRPSVLIRNLVSSDELVEDGSGVARGQMNDRIAALEMEASGFAATCHHLGVPWLVVRGIADYGTADRDKRWQVYSAAAAMSFARTFLENEYTPGIPIPGTRR